MANIVSPLAATRLKSFDATGTVFSEFTALAIKHKAINLGQGFPTFPVADFVRFAASKAVLDESLGHQYTRSEGHIRLVNALAKFYTPSLGRQLNPLTEIITTAGAAEALYSTIQALISPGDEVILMQPFYDSYPANVILAGGIPVIVSLSPKNNKSPTNGESTSDNWRLDMSELRSVVTKKTKMIIINNPHNPIGKVFRREELLEIADFAKEFNLLVLADEVYETLVYTDSVAPFIKIASLPGMFERTITVGSVGKAFGITGWRVGWTLASKEITRAIWLIHQFVPFCIQTPLQEATAVSFEEAETNGFFETNRKLYQEHRDKLIAMLKSVGLKPTLPHGGYFVLADILSVPFSENSEFAGESRRDYRICKQLTVEAGVTAIPPSAFYKSGSKDADEVAGGLARFAFCKTSEMLDEAGKRLEKYFEK
ncbi:Kynurenine--oxoglutarate transaminase 3 [Nowakowskiella sp. JEL0078]|nr:Kynurenine--oxoglutarate transaminase 3 [Nowakowskiella sp. JEL0078]